MKKLFAVLLFASLALPAFAQLGDFTFDGFIRTGFVWTKEEKINKDPLEKVRLGNLDDAGNDHGRIRLDFTYALNNVGIKGRLQWDNWQSDFQAPPWPYIFGYINSFEDQLTISMGKLGASPWSTGGPEKWKELEVTDKGGGVRFEYKPTYLFFNGLNVGFVLNWFNGSTDRGGTDKISLLDILQESVLGISYTHEYFLVRFAYRLDSSIDQRPGSFASGREGDDLIYRVEERIIGNYLPGFQIWALGVYEGVGAEEKAKDCIHFENWLFAQYAPDWGTAQIRLGYDVVQTRSILHFKPSYYHNFFDKFITVGAFFYIANDFGDDKVNKDAPYLEMQVEPKIQFNFANSYVAFTYNFKQNYIAKTPLADPPIERYQTMNLRFGMSF